jgi:hypothetical protein
MPDYKAMFGKCLFSRWYLRWYLRWCSRCVLRSLPRFYLGFSPEAKQAEVAARDAKIAEQAAKIAAEQAKVAAEQAKVAEQAAKIAEQAAENATLKKTQGFISLPSSVRTCACVLIVDFSVPNNPTEPTVCSFPNSGSVAFQVRWWAYPESVSPQRTHLHPTSACRVQGSGSKVRI